MNMHRRGGGSRLITTKLEQTRDGPYPGIEKMGGEEAVVSIRSSWDSSETGYRGREWQSSEGVVMNLIEQGLSEREIRRFISVGGSRISRFRKAIESGIDSLHSRCSASKPSHAFVDSVIDYFKGNCATCVLEDASRVRIGYQDKPNITWKVIHDRYFGENTRAKPGVRTMRYSRFTQYRRYYFSGVRLTRSVVDIQLQQPDLTEDERNVLLLEPSTILDSATAQRRLLSNFIKVSSALHAPEPILPIIQNFVLVDITNKWNKVYFYDERTQGKNADALCGFRLLFHLATLQNNVRNNITPAEVSFSLMNNCVGQNKSKVVLTFFRCFRLYFLTRK
ncbi:Cleavage inducible protein [Phytophthora megakarya]|uniref:Cleavage inducible protein n=1 Tax=Phytophthora megakarya TaxID=4795 RepID=A0A225WTR0_9STRA|nr:Cleavage inducible protein [Phytophthora megakarya]